jgi:hypothetical protein
MDELYKDFTGVLYTAGVKHIADTAAGGNGAYWLITAIGSFQGRGYPQVQAEEFQLWTLRVHPDRSATLTMQPDSDKPAVITQTIPWTDFDEEVCELYVLRTPGQKPLICQPCEY